LEVVEMLEIELDKFERKFREYEVGIMRLKQFEIELKSLNVEGLESEANAIKSKLKGPKRVEEIEADIEILKVKIKEREEWKKTTPGLFDTAQRLANEATKLFEGKEYEKSLEKYQGSLIKFIDARNGAEKLKDEELVKAVGIDVYNVKKSIIACENAIGVSFSEDAKKSFDLGNYEDAISAYRNVIAKFDDAIKDAKEIDDSESVEQIECSIKGAEENIENCHVAIDKREVENLFRESKSLHERATVLARGGEMFNAKGILRDAEAKVNSAFEISTKRKFSDAVNKLNLLLKIIRDEMNVIDGGIANGITSVDFGADIFKVKVEGEPEIEKPSERIEEGGKRISFFPPKPISPPESTPSPTAPTTHFTTFRTVWDPSNKDFVWDAEKPDEYGELPRIKEWIRNKNPNIYWRSQIPQTTRLQNGTSRSTPSRLSQSPKHTSINNRFAS
jgi:tetratricopeptide (TPR) repeat protein